VQPARTAACSGQGGNKELLDCKLLQNLCVMARHNHIWIPCLRLQAKHACWPENMLPVIKLDNLACQLQVQCHGCTYFDPVLSKMNPAVSAQQFSPDVAGAVLPSLSSSSSD